MSESRITRRFEELAEEGRSALIVYVTAGFPEVDTTLPLLEGLADVGADVIELGIPFSDPMADGPTIQASSFRALENGVTVSGVLDMVRAFRERRDTPVVLFTYLNPVVRYGAERFCAEARSAGADGVLFTDLPAGADPALESAASSAGLDLIRLLAPTTTPSRVRRVAEGAAGFLYYISRTGVTGARSELSETLAEEVSRVRDAVDLPVAVGFGISTADQARQVASVAEGVVVGSALVQTLEREGIAGALAFVGGLRAGMDEPSG